MNKTEFVAAIAEEAGISKTDAAKAVKAFTDVVVEAVSYTHLTLPTILRV